MDMHSDSFRAPQLDDRLEAAVAMAMPCCVGADIGADHGKLSAAMLMRGLSRHMLVSDISSKALDKSRLLMSSLQLNDQVTFAVADGLDAALTTPQPVDTYFILGMGGETMAHILQEGAGVLSGAKLILSPQTDVPLVRQVLCEIGYRLRQEDVVHSAGRDYILMRAEPAQEGEPDYTPQELILGPILMKQRPAAWQGYLLRELQYIQKAVQAMEKASTCKDEDRLSHFRQTLSYVQEALGFYEKEITP
ncbi:MAG: SAM-dependent methyltransferase [Clostridiales bacterium]|nr:SAM-dependent methyltransferase [Clostridiales bacterium]